MKKHLFLLIIALFGTIYVFSDNYWRPRERYARWIRSISLDKSWEFGDEGSRDNDKEDPDHNVQTTDAPGYLCFNLLSWNENKSVSIDHYLFWAEIYLYNATTQQDYKICKIYLTDDYHGRYTSAKYSEGNPYKIDQANNNTTYLVQTRFHKEYEDGTRFCYFVTQYSESLRTFADNAGNALKIKITCKWNGSSDTDGEKTFTESSELWADGKRITFMTPLVKPTLSISGWEDKDYTTQLGYKCQTINLEAKTILNLCTNSKTEKLYEENLALTNAYIPLMNHYTSDLASQYLASGEIRLEAQNYKTYPIVKSYWMKEDSCAACGAFPDYTTLYSEKVTVYAPKFMQPARLEVKDEGTGYATLGWDMDTTGVRVSDDHSGFVVQCYADENYTNLLQQTTTNYVGGTTRYSVQMPFSERNEGKKTYYYRVYRENANANEFNANVSAELNTNYVKPNSLIAKDTLDKVLLKWGLSNEGLWTSETYLELKRNNMSIGTYSREVTSVFADLDECTPTDFTLSVVDGGITRNSYSLSQFMRAADTSGVISSLSVSKGFYNDHTTIVWTVDKEHNRFSFFNVLRCPMAEVGQVDARWVNVTSITHTAGMEKYSYQDNTITPGEYYMYRVDGYAQCDIQTHLVSHQDGVGFAQPYGAIAGQVTLSNGQGQSGIRVTAHGEDVCRGRSLYFADSNGASTAYYAALTADKADDIMKPNSGTVEMWLRADDSNHDLPILYRDGILDYRITADKQLCFRCQQVTNATLSYSLQGSPLWNANRFNHVAISYKVVDSQLTLQLMINGHVAKTLQLAALSSVYVPSTDTLYLGTDGKESFFGYMDEIRFWNTFRDSAAVVNTMDGYLSGTESGLTGYYRCDDDNTGELYDISKTTSNFNERHMRVVGAKTDPNIVPDANQLALATRTDSKGNYVLNMIPYNAAGSYYTVMPVMGIHTFSPTNQPLYFSGNAAVHNRVNFTDESSFTVSGRVLYENTNYPVSGCQIYIDGEVAMMTDNSVSTDEQGCYTVQVPIGEHCIEVAKDGHTFLNAGRFPTTEGQTYDFQEDRVDVDFVDQTYVTLAGRVVGGHREASKVHGMQQCKNNIGTAIIQLSAGDNYILNTGSETRTWAVPAGCEVRSKTTTDTDETKQSLITIVTDSVTGEFAVRVPPIDMSVRGIHIPSHPTYLFSPEDYGMIDMGSCTITDTIVDSLKIDDEMHYFSYLRSLDIVHYADPVMSFEQAGRTDGSYGDAYMVKQIAEGQFDTIPFYTVDGEHVHYTFGYPIYTQYQVYSNDVAIYEPYYNYDKDASHPVLDAMPYANCVVTFANQLGEKEVLEQDTAITDTLWNETQHYSRGEVIAISEEQILLDSTGHGVYAFQVGEPNIMEDQNFAFPLNISYLSPDGKRTYTWRPDSTFYGIILGGLNSGNQFLTAGPDKLSYILRDPAGSMSYATLTQGSTFSSKVHTSTTSSTSNGGEAYVSLAPTLIHTKRLSKSKSLTITNEIIVHGTYNNLTTGETQDEIDAERTVEIVREISTASDNYHVLTPGDVYIGYSTNTVFGNAQTVCIEKVGGEYKLVLRDKVTVGTAYDTEFSYSQFYIENTLLTNYIKLRNALDWHTEVNSDIYNKLDSSYNSESQLQYYTTLSREDPNFGTEGTYKAVYPKNWRELNIPGDIDMVNYYNSEYNKWIQILSANEEAKVTAIKDDSYLVRNVSFDGGSIRTDSYTETYTQDTTQTHSRSVLHTYDVCVGFFYNNAGASGTYRRVEETTTTKDTTLTESMSTTITSTLVANTLEAISMDVRRAPDGFGPVFNNRGGQTYCPYEDEEKTRYYKPGEYTIHQATVKMQDPKITVETPVVNDVPVGGEASFQLAMANRADIGSENFAWMRLLTVAGSNPYGAKIYVEGKSIAGDGTGDGVIYRFYPGETLHANVTIAQTNKDIVDYDSIAIALTSDCEPYDMRDVVYLSAHFVPACSGVKINVDNRIVNTRTDTTVKVLVYDYDRNYGNLSSIKLQYHSQGDNTWNLLHEWVTDSTQIGPHTSLLNSASVSYSWDMDNSSIFPDGVYELRAVTQCAYGNDMIECESDYVIVTKDISRPQSLGEPSPINGVWTADNELYVVYNDKIQPDMILPDYVQVKTQKNRHTLTHEVALASTGNTIGAATESSLSVSSDGFSWEAWVNCSDAATLWRHGDETGLSLGIDAAGHLVVTTPNKQITSINTLPLNKWCYLMVTMSEQTDSTAFLQAWAAYDAVNVTLIQAEPVSLYQRTAPMSIGVSGESMLHDLILWSKTRAEAVMLSDRNLSKELYSDGVIGYWPMDEGRGTVASDVLRHRDLVLDGAHWWYTGVNYAKHVTPLQPETIVVADKMRAEDANFVMEMWLRLPEEGEILRTADSTSIISYGNGLVSIATPEQTFTAESASDWTDHQWHQLTIMGNRYGKMVTIVDGVRRESPIGQYMPDFTKNAIVFGAQMPIDIDEVRIWSGDISEGWLEEYRYTQLSTDTLIQYPGLAYYKDYNDTQESARAETTPALKPAVQLESVDHTYTANEEKVVINITESPSNIEGCILEITVQHLLDQYSNLSLPVTWTAYVDRNQLVWGESEVNVTMANREQKSWDIDILNNSGHSESWTIENSPEWLSFSYSTGTLSPLTNQHLTATIDPSLAIGRHEAVVYLTGNEGIKEPLYVNVQVTGDTPDWVVTPANWEQSMNLVAVATKNGIAMDDAEDLVAAFCDNKVVGVAHPQYIASKGKYMVLMDIYANTSDTNAITFRYWDASTGSIYSNIGIVIDNQPAIASLTFRANKVYGSLAKPVSLILSSTMDMPVDLVKGWNWVSFNVLDNTLSATKQLQSLLPSIHQIKSNEAYSEVLDNNLYGELNKLDYAYTYKINATKDAFAYISGQPADALQVGITLKAGGWSWIGYVPQLSLNVNTALANLNPTKGDVIKAQSGFAMWNGVEWIGSLTVMYPGEGYLYYNASSTDQTLYYPSTSVLTNNAPSLRKNSLSMGEGRGEASSAFTPIDPRVYQGNMTVTAKVMNGSVEVTDAEVGIFAGDECRAAATWLSADSTSLGAYFILVPGDESIPLTIKVVSGGETIIPEQGITFVDDAMVGSLAEPYIIQIGNEADVDSLSVGEGRGEASPYKFLKDGILYIVHDGQVYTAEGAVVK